MADVKNRFYLVALLGFLSGVYLFVFSGSGLLERMNLERKSRVLLGNIGKLEHEKASLEKTLRAYEGGSMPDRDVLNAGLIGRGDRLVVLDDKGRKTVSDTLRDKPGDAFSIQIFHYRVLWIVLSILVMLFYFSRKRHGEEASGNV